MLTSLPGTKISFKPDPKIFQDCTFDYDRVVARCRELAYLNEGLAFYIEDERTGKKDEFNDIADNRHDFLIIASSLRPTGVQIGSSRLNATVHTFCSFTSKVITTQPREEGCQHGECPLNSVGTAQGDCYTTNVYEKGRWWICESHFLGAAPLSPMMRAFFGTRGSGLP